MWDAGAVKNTWLQVTLRGNDPFGEFDANTGLDASDVFYFGNLVGDSLLGDPPQAFVTNVNDEIGARLHYDFGLPIDNAYDFDRNGAVNVNDEILARLNYRFLNRLSVPDVVAASASAAVSADDAAMPLAAVPTDDVAAAGVAAVEIANVDAPEWGIASALALRQRPAPQANRRPQLALENPPRVRALDSARVARNFEPLVAHSRATGIKLSPDGEGHDHRTPVIDELLAALRRGN